MCEKCHDKMAAQAKAQSQRMQQLAQRAGATPKKAKAPSAAGAKAAKAGNAPNAATPVIIEAAPAPQPNVFESVGSAIGNAVGGAAKAVGEAVTHGVEAVEHAEQWVEKTGAAVVQAAKPVVQAVQAGLEVVAAARAAYNEGKELVETVSDAVQGKVHWEWPNLTHEKDGPATAEKYGEAWKQVLERAKPRVTPPDSAFNDNASFWGGARKPGWSWVAAEANPRNLGNGNSITHVKQGPSLIDQTPRGVCGPTSVMHAFADWDPEGYKQFAKELLETGRVKDKLVGEELRKNRPGGVAPNGGYVNAGDRMYEADYATILSLTNTVHQVIPFDGGCDAAWKEEGPLTLALPEQVSYWMRTLLGCVEAKVFVCRYSKDELTPFTDLRGLLNNSVISHLLRGQGTDAEKAEAEKAALDAGSAWLHPRAREVSKKISELQGKYGGSGGDKKITVTCLISAGTFLEGDKDFRVKNSQPPAIIPDHYVRLLEEMQWNDDGSVQVHVHSWGSEWKVKFDDTPGNRLEDHCWAFVVGAKEKGLLDDVPGIVLPETGIIL